MTGWLIGAAVVFVIALIVRLFERRYDHEQDEWFARAVKTTGTISRIIKRKVSYSGDYGDSTGVERIPVIRFRAANNVEYEFDSGQSSLKVGDSVPVAYDPDLPSSAKLVPRKNPIGCWMILMAVALGLVIRSFLDL